MDHDGDVGEKDLSTLAGGFGQTDVAEDTNGDADMDGADLYKLAISFNRTNCIP